MLVWGAVIFTASTSAFTAGNTAKFIDPIIVWFFPHISPSSLAVAHAMVRKCGHFTEYAVLYCLLVRGPMAGRPYMALMLCAAYALCDEGHQLFVPGRSASLYDVALDTTGAAFGGFVYATVSEIFRRGGAVQESSSLEEMRSIRP